MAFIWKEMYNTGFKEMDRQHQELFLVGQELYDYLLMENEKKQRQEEDLLRIELLIGRLKECSQVHFQFEEVLHHDEKRLHIERILLFMTDWLSKHSVNSEDKQVVRYMKHNNINMEQFTCDVEKR